MHEIIASVSEWMMNLISSLGYFGVIIGMFLNSAGIPIPSEIIAGFSGYLVYKGTLSIYLIGPIAAIGNVIGGTIQYMIGNKGGRPAIQKYGKYVHFSEEKFAKMEKWFAKWGDELVLAGQFIPVFRSYISFPAGVLKVNFKKYIAYTFLGSAIWITLIAFISSRLGENWETIGTYMKKFEIVIFVVILLGIAFLAYKYLSHSKKSKQN